MIFWYPWYVGLLNISDWAELKKSSRATSLQLSAIKMGRGPPKGIHYLLMVGPKPSFRDGRIRHLALDRKADFYVSHLYIKSGAHLSRMSWNRVKIITEMCLSFKMALGLQTNSVQMKVLLHTVAFNGDISLAQPVPTAKSVCCWTAFIWYMYT